MDFEEARYLLLLHSFALERSLEPRVETGFLGMLRPYRGLNEQNFDEVLEAIMTLAPYLRSEPDVDREVIAALWAICHLGRMWGTHPDSLLRANGLIGAADLARLDGWLTAISFAVLALLEGGDVVDALEEYRAR